MELALRPISADELTAYKRTDEYGFGYRHEENAPEREGWADAELDRTVAIFEGDEIVATGRNYSLELTLPGGVPIPTGAVSWISVRPTHRRRGFLRLMMEYLLDECAARGECASILTASEGGIYRRFGYGVASRVLEIELRRAEVAFQHPVTDGRLRMVEPEEGRKLAPELFERVRATRNGAVSRPAEWWDGEWAVPSMVKNRFDVVYERDGRIEGYVLYGVDGTWQDGFSAKTLGVQDLVAATPDAEAALWQYLCDVDLVNTVTHWTVPPDIELPWRLRDTRQMRTTTYRDWLWVRPVDVPALLQTRRYLTSGRLVLEVRDEMRPDGDAAGRFRLEAGPDGAECARTDAAPDLVLDVAALGAISLGGLDASTMARAGTAEERTPGALRTADALFAADRAPFAFTWF
jgi:predicted acetyltransferase